MIEAFKFLADQIPPSWLAGGLVIWLVIAFGNSQKRDTFMENSWKLLTAPSELKDYSEEWLTRTEKAFRDALVNPINKLLHWLIKFGQSIWDNNKWKLIGQLAMAFFLPFFFVVDAIAIYNVLDAMGLPVEYLPIGIQMVLNQFSLAVAGGTFFSIIISGFVLFEIFGNSEFSDFGTYAEQLKKFIKTTSIIIVISSLFAGVMLGFSAWKALGTLPSWLQWTDGLVWFSTQILVRMNVLVATFLILLESFKGLRSILLLLIGIGIVISGMIMTILSVIASFGRLALDWIGRFIRWLLWLISFLIFAPIDAIKSSPQNLVSFVKDLLGRK